MAGPMSATVLAPSPIPLADPVPAMLSEVDRDRRVASAPCNYGAFERGQHRPEPDVVLAAIRDAGYAATDLGPEGFLGEGALLRDRLDRYGLRLSGGWRELSLDSGDLAPVDALLDAFDAVASDLPPDERPRATLGVPGPDDARCGEPAELDPDGWSRLVGLVTAAAERCHRRGYMPTFQPHVGSWVETAEHVERLLDLTDLGLTLDTGHLVLAGADPLEALLVWAPRIGHVQLKDVDADRFASLREVRAPIAEVWRQGVFVELGRGDADLDAFLDALAGYRGWLVVEQERLPSDDPSMPEQREADRRDRDFLRWHGW